MEILWAPWRMEYILSPKEDSCIFCTPLQQRDDRRNLILHRGKESFIILNRYPYTNGHLMVAPYRHIGLLEELSAEEVKDLMINIQLSIRVLKGAMSPHGFNIGANVGKVAGAGVEGHVHFHIVPRWEGDTNYMPVLASTRVIPEHLQQTYDRLRDFLERLLAR
ncbi:MAG: HIT family hydrolase [Deltaproteobacteria bacterium]|nr:MAG: HIT family hydrolase [Deltaproteobacteria bacterium]